METGAWSGHNSPAAIILPSEGINSLLPGLQSGGRKQSLCPPCFRVALHDGHKPNQSEGNAPPALTLVHSGLKEKKQTKMIVGTIVGSLGLRAQH